MFQNQTYPWLDSGFPLRTSYGSSPHMGLFHDLGSEPLWIPGRVYFPIGLLLRNRPQGWGFNRIKDAVRLETQETARYPV